MLFSLSNKHIPFYLHKLLLSELKSAELVVLVKGVPACMTDAQCLCGRYFKGSSCKSRASRVKLNVRLIILIFLIIPGAWCVVQQSL